MHEDWVRVQGVVDSGAAAPVAPPSMAPGLPVRESAGSKAGKTYTSASGHGMENLGEQLLACVTDNGIATEVLFQMADVSCPLVSVSAICDQGNRVVFGRGGGCIQNLTTGLEVPFERRGGVYALGLWVKGAAAGSAVHLLQSGPRRWHSSSPWPVRVRVRVRGSG